MTTTRWIDRNRIVAYVIIAYGFTWSLASLIIADRFGFGNAPGWLHYAAAYGPLVSTFVVTMWADGRDGLRDLLARLVRVRFHPVWWAVSLSPIIMIALVDLGVLLATGSGLSLTGLGEIDGVGNLGLIGAAAFWLITFGLGEETGWRGFLQHHLEQRRTSRNNALIVGLIWAGWHIPFFFYQENYIAMGMVGMVGWLIGLMAGAVFLAWVYNGTKGSILAVMLWHATFDLATAAPMSGAILAPVLSMAVIIAAIVIRNTQHQQEKSGVIKPIRYNAN